MIYNIVLTYFRSIFGESQILQDRVCEGEWGIESPFFTQQLNVAQLQQQTQFSLYSALCVFLL